MRAAGFADVSFVDVAAVFACKQAELTYFLAKSTVRMTMVLKAQAPEVRPAIDRSIEKRLGSYAVGDALKVPLPALLVAGQRLA